MKKIIIAVALFFVGIAANAQNIQGSDSTLEYLGKGIEGVDTIKFSYYQEKYEQMYEALLLILDQQLYVDSIHEIGFGVYAIATYYDGYVQCYPLNEDGTVQFKEYFVIKDERFAEGNLDIVE